MTGERPRRGRHGRSLTAAVAQTQPQLLPVPTQGLETDERYTPSWVFDDLAVRFDLDVASPEGGVAWIPADRHYTAQDDGLAQEWRGLVWCNPPFSLAESFALKWLAHNNGIGLFPLSQAKWVGSLLDSVDRLNIPSNIKFESPSHSGRHVSFAVAIVGVGPVAYAVERLRGTTFSPVRVRLAVEDTE